MHIKVIGQGPDLVMLHGWSMHSAVWHDLADELAKNFTLHLVDLPGHGQSSWQQGDLELDVLVNNLAMELPETAYWLGWSLGGLISLAFADRFPVRVRKLILMAATPCFVKKDDWLCAMDTTIFKLFADNLNVNQAETLQRFLLLQARGSDHSRDTIRQLGEQLAIENPPSSEALQAGLKLLIETDMRMQFADLTCPVQMILGDRDTLIPEEMLPAAKQLQAEVDVKLLPGAGHAPFISQPVECNNLIESFINE
ncbi:MAG: pimeloyl-[acyl-carrier protein] methyl ester esterase [Gammaproteobacteria bacterium]|nr:MAG: pimeloyl-[acyl-carrier protein] methyl ester esterase [Gammaproteobacteria bacterium]